MEKLKVQTFTDYRSFLLAHAQDKKRLSRDWTYGIWARSIGLKDTSSITKIIQGQRHPGPDITKKLINYFRFNEKESLYFSDLVAFQKIKSDPRLSVVLLEKMGKQNPNISSKVLDDKSFSLISNWYCLAIREMVRLESFFEDPNWISKNFNFKVTPKEASRALELLFDLELLSRDKSGKIKITTGRYSTANDYSSEAIKRFHEATLDNAKQAIRQLSVTEREFSASTFTMKRSNLPQAKQLIREFKERFEELLEEDQGDNVFQLQIQFYPLTKNLKTTGEVSNED